MHIIKEISILKNSADGPTAVFYAGKIGDLYLLGGIVLAILMSVIFFVYLLRKDKK